MSLYETGGENTDTEGKSCGGAGRETATSQGIPGPPEAERREASLFSRASGQSVAWPILRFQTFGLQNCERIYLSCFKPLSLWPFVPAALGNDSKCAPNDGLPAWGLLPQEMLSPSLREFARAAGSAAGSATSSWECKHPMGLWLKIHAGEGIWGCFRHLLVDSLGEMA